MKLILPLTKTWDLENRERTEFLFYSHLTIYSFQGMITSDDYPWAQITSNALHGPSVYNLLSTKLF